MFLNVPESAGRGKKQGRHAGPPGETCQAKSLRASGNNDLTCQIQRKCIVPVGNKVKVWGKVLCKKRELSPCLPWEVCCIVAVLGEGD